ncbi:MAG: integrase [Arenicella sp.]|jgi:integrase
MLDLCHHLLAKYTMNAAQAKSLVTKGVTGRHAVGNGLYLRVSKENTGYWVVRYSIFGMRREITLGRFDALSLARANLKAAEIKLDVKEGKDPLVEKEREKSGHLLTVNDLAEDWFQECDSRLKNPRIPRQVYRDYIQPSLGKHAIHKVTALDVRGAIKRIKSKGATTRANDALMYLKQLFTHAIKLGLIEINPATAFTNTDAGGQEKSRTRALSLDEISHVLKIMRTHTDQFARENYLAVLLLLTLGVRKVELVASKWVEFDLVAGIWKLPAERSKTGVAISIPLSKEVICWLEELFIRSNSSEYVLPNRRESKRYKHIRPDTLNAAIAKLFKDNKLKVDHFTVHDLRRTCRSILAELRVPSHIAERCLNHKVRGVEGIYDRYDYFEERSEALSLLAETITTLTD